MATNPELSVEITAKIDGLRDAFNKAVRETSNFNSKTRTELSAIDKGFASLANDVDQSMTRLAGSAKKGSNDVSKSLAQAAQISSTSGKSISTGSNQAAFALTNLGRVAQDAPFGFIGIQNNLNPLLESFQSLIVKEGGVSAALKSLGSGLIGPAGLGIALSLVTAAFTFYTMWAQKATKATKQAADQYGLYNQAISQGNKDAGKQIADLSALYSATINVSNSQDTRNKAALELIEISGGVFKASDKERLKNGELGDAYKALTLDIIANARAKALQDKISGLTAQRLDAEIKLQKIANANANESANAKDARQEIGLGQSIVFTKEQQIVASNGRAAAATKETKSVISGIEEQIKFLSRLQGSDSTIVDAIVGTESKEKIAKKFKSLSDILKELSIDLKLNEGQLDLTFNEKRLKDLDSYQKAIDELTKNGFAPQGAEIAKLAAQYDKLATAIRGSQLADINPNAPQNTGSKLPKGIDESNRKVKVEDILLPSSGLKKYIEDLEADINKLGELPNVVSTIGSALSSSFVAMGEAIANGGDALSAAGGILKSLVAGIMVSLGQQLITLGTAKVAAGILSFPEGAPLIAQGTGLIALGGALTVGAGLVKGSGGGSTKENTPNRRNIPGFANGVTNYGGGLAIVGEEGPELVRLPSGSDVIPNRQSMAMMVGGRNNVNVTGEFKLSGRDLVAVIEQVNALRQRSR